MGENSTSENTDDENNLRYEVFKVSSSEEENSKNEEDRHSKRINKLENHLEAITHRSDLQELGVVSSYPVKWDAAPYPSSLRRQPYKLLMAKAYRTNIYTTSSFKLKM